MWFQKVLPINIYLVCLFTNKLKHFLKFLSFFNEMCFDLYFDKYEQNECKCFGRVLVPAWLYFTSNMPMFFLLGFSFEWLQTISSCSLLQLTIHWVFIFVKGHIITFNCLHLWISRKLISLAIIWMFLYKLNINKKNLVWVPMRNGVLTRI